MQIIPSSGLQDAEIDQMVQDAEQHAADDLKRKEDVEARNMADSSVYAAEKFLADNAEAIPDAQKTAVQAQIDVVKSAMEGGDTVAMKESAGQLQNVLQQAGAAMYQQQGGTADPEAGGFPGGDPGAGPAGDSSGGADDDVIEGEFSE
jgi:molecular chaperone DnaK